MAGVETNDFSAPDEVRRPDRTNIEIVKLGGGEIGRFTFQPGWSWSGCIKPVVGGESCQTEHVGYMISGRLQVRMDDGTEITINPGDAYSVPPGHDGWVIGEEPVVVVEFQGAATYAKG